MHSYIHTHIHLLESVFAFTELLRKLFLSYPLTEYWIAKEYVCPCSRPFIVADKWLPGKQRTEEREVLSRVEPDSSAEMANNT